MSEHLQAVPGGPGISGHPELEELAALADGKLSRTEADRVRAHLASCEECYEVFAETLHLLDDFDEVSVAAAASPSSEDEPAEDGGVDTVVPFPSPANLDSELPTQLPFQENLRPHLWWAAAVLVAVTLGFGVYRFFAAPNLSVASLATQVAEGKRLTSQAWGERTRGVGTREGDPSLRLGVELLNLQVALQAGDRSAADGAAATINGLLEPISFMSEDSKKFYRQLRVRLSTGDAKALANEAAKEADVLRGSDSVTQAYFDLGSWAEAGRFAAIAGVPTFFQAPSAQDLRTRLKKEEGTGLPPEVEKALEVIDRARLNPSKDYGTLKEAFEQILDYYYPQGHPIG